MKKEPQSQNKREKHTDSDATSHVRDVNGHEIFVYTDQTEHTARCFSAYLPPIQCTLSGHQCMMLIQV